jgi:replicative DNA helicase
MPRCPTEERTILGVILESNSEAYDSAAQQGLASEDFYLSSHRLIYNVVAEMAEAGEATDIVSAAGRLRDRGQLAQIGGEAYLADLIGGVVYEHRAFKGYVKRIRDAADRRRLIAACQATALHACDNGSRAEECMELLSENLLSIQAGSFATATQLIGTDDDYSAWSQLADKGETRIGLTTGITCLDTATAESGPASTHFTAGAPAMERPASDYRPVQPTAGTTCRC